MDLLFLCLTLIISPLVFCPLKSLDGYILPQIGIAAIGISLTTIFFISNGFFPINLTSVLALLYFLYLMMSCSWSTVPHNSLRDVPLIFVSIFGFIIASYLFKNFSNIVGVSLSVFFVSMITSIYAIGQKFRIDFLFPERVKSRTEDFKGKTKEQIPTFFYNKNFIDSRSISSLGNTNFAAGYFLSALPFLIFLTVEISIWFLLSIMILVSAIICTQCRAAILAIVISILSFLFLISFRGLVFDSCFVLFANLPMHLFLALLSFVLFIGLHFLLKVRRINPLKILSNKQCRINTHLDIEHTHQDHPIAHLRYRLRYWRAAWELIKKKPLQGYGLRTYRKEVYYAQGVLHAKDGQFLGKNYQTPQPRECHNDFIENFVEGGITGGLLFLVILFIIFFHGFEFLCNVNSIKDFVLISGVLSGIIGVLVNVFFFFPLRLSSSVLAIWIGLAMIEGITGSIELISFQSNFILVLFVLLALSAMIWEGSIKPNLGNYYFRCYSFSSVAINKERYLQKALTYCPKDTIFRTHAMIGYIDAFPNEADQHAESMRQHFDGMTPAWVMALNSGIAKVANKQYEDAVRFFKDSLFFYPLFDAAKAELQKIWHLAPFPRRRIMSKQVTAEGINAIAFYQSEIKNLKSVIQTTEANLVNIILSEKLKMNIPLDWVFDLENKMFLSPKEITPNMQIVQVGAAKIPIAIKKQNGGS